MPVGSSQWNAGTEASPTMEESLKRQGVRPQVGALLAKSGGEAGAREVPALSGRPGDLAGAVKLEQPRAAWEVGPRSRAAGGSSGRGTTLKSADDAYKIRDRQER
ncbi:hypothetical protein NDU88_002014 [Pleurodeles waltl]|uniref:Uncharacterized protein n=1 Tax=Pleurodeles waltl TaxID=8319 RepID=A0AAV7NCF4_PLEWA|nr:hypothetical protein NDU88_002014 [Pleurodeles waltl]